MIDITTQMKLRYYHIGIAVFCLAIMVISFIVLIADAGEKHSTPLKIFLTLAIQMGGAFFFALTAGYVSDALQQAKGYHSGRMFEEENRKAGLLNFYADRDGGAKTDLDKAFEVQEEGEVLMIGASLRKFFASGQPHEKAVKKLLGRNGVSVRAVFSNPEGNRELPVRSFIEVFNRGAYSPKVGKGTFDMKEEIDFDFDDFVENFYKKYGVNKSHTRTIDDLIAAKRGVEEDLSYVAEGAGSSIKHRLSNSAPYCTVIIFPDKAFYTPNLLSKKMPVNFPTLVFEKPSEVYERLVEYFEFQWWVSDPRWRSKDA